MGRHFLLVSAVLITYAMPVLAEEGKLDEAPLTKADGLYMAYGYSFITYDKCGNSALGKRYREAVIAKLESCPFTEEAKLEFYKKIASDASQGQTELLDFILTHSASQCILPDSGYCQQDDWGHVKHLREKLAEYDAGKISLSDVLTGPKGYDKPYASCVAASRAWGEPPVEGTPPAEGAGTGKHVNAEPSNK